jgi:(p)ppGpp synthase/HD superfamily hydrolase
MNKNKQLDAAIQIAVNAHAGQFDRGGKPYILHPIHLMNQLMFDVELATIAVLHDVIEDSDIELSDIENAGFSNRVISVLDLLTHKEGESYEEYIDKICTNYDAIRVKRKDLEHNSNITRLKNKTISEKDINRIVKYQKAFLKLGDAKKQFCTQ